jgi:CubicO group peptidase (beta-lactamase class C family)
MKKFTRRRGLWARNSLMAVFTFTLTIFSVLGSSIAEAQVDIKPAQLSANPGLTDPEEVEEFLDTVIPKELSDRHVAGAVVAIVKDGALFFAKGYGYADVEGEIPVDPDSTLFRVGSIGKLFTWTAVMQLAEQGKLDLDADVNQYLDFTIPATFPEPITLKHLMTHTPGFEDNAFGFAATTPEGMVSIGEWLANNVPARVWPAGEVPAYSNYGATLAGYIVERVSGMPYEDYIEQHILAPLDMKNSTPRQPPPAALEADMALGYEYQDNAFQPQGFEYMTIAPAGSISSTATDMARFMIAHLQLGRYGEARILGEDTARQMQSRLWTADERLNGMTYGFMELSQNGYRVTGHPGDTGLFHSILALLPEQNVGLLFSYNSAGYGIGATILEAFMDEYYPPAGNQSPEPLADSAERINRFTGTYQFTRLAYTKGGKLKGLFSTASVQPGSDGELIITMAGNTDSQRLVEVAPLYFEEIEGDGRLVFREDDDGDIAYLYSNIPPMQPVFGAKKVAWYETLSFNIGLLAVCAVLFVLVLLVEPVRLAVGWFRRRTRPSQPALARLARGLMVALAVLSLATVFGLYTQVFDGWGLASGQRGILTATGGMAILIVALTIAVVFLASLAWRRSWWGVGGRIYYTLVSLASVAFVWFLAFWNQIGWQWW